MGLQHFTEVRVSTDKKTVEVVGELPLDQAGDKEIAFETNPVICWSVVQGSVVLNGDTSTAIKTWRDSTGNKGLEADQPALCAAVAIIFRSGAGNPAFDVFTWSEEKLVEEGPATTD